MNLTEEELFFLLSQPYKRAEAFSAVFRTYQERIYWHIPKNGVVAR